MTSGGALYLFDPYTMDKIYHVTAHAHPIKYLLWRGIDQMIITCCEAGSIFSWESRGLTKSFEHFP